MKALNKQALLDELEAAEKVNAELSKAARVSSQWKPDVCPITGRNFFMWINHPKHGYVPTYGGPFDSYTIPVRDSDGEFSCERYDHDLGNWREGECVGLYLIDDDEQCRVYELEQRIAELEAREVTLPPLNDDLIAILGRPNFTCSHLAELMRKSGDEIRRKSEHEQAAVIHWFLGIYLEHGDKWEGIAKADIQSRVAASGIGVKGE